MQALLQTRRALLYAHRTGATVATPEKRGDTFGSDRLKLNRPPRLRRRRRSWEAFVRVHTVASACKESGTHRSTHYRWLAADPDYVDRFETAKDEAVELLEAEARRRALGGVERIKYYQGKKIGSEREYSDNLLMFLLKANRPEKYRERYDVNQVVTDKRIDPTIGELVDRMKPKRLKQITAALRAAERETDDTVH